MQNIGSSQYDERFGVEACPLPRHAKTKMVEHQRIQFAGGLQTFGAEQHHGKRQKMEGDEDAQKLVDAPGVAFGKFRAQVHRGKGERDGQPV